jgi:hypothetical protein
VLPLSTIHSHQIHLALGALAGECLGIDAAAEALQPRHVVVQENAVQVGDVNPQAEALPAPSQRRFPLQLSHLDDAAGAIHGGLGLLL